MPTEFPEATSSFGLSLVKNRAVRRCAKLRRLQPITARHGQRERSASTARERDMLRNHGV